MAFTQWLDPVGAGLRELGHVGQTYGLCAECVEVLPYIYGYGISRCMDTGDIAFVRPYP